MKAEDQKELMQIWQVLGLSLLYLSENKQEFFKLIRDELGYHWDGKGWRKNTPLH